MDSWVAVVCLNLLQLSYYYVDGRGNFYPIQQNSFLDQPPCYTPYYGQDVATVDPFQTLNGVTSGPLCVRMCQASPQCTSTVFDRIHCCCFMYNRQLANNDVVQRATRDYYVLDRQCAGSGPGPISPPLTTPFPTSRLPPGTNPPTPTNPPATTRTPSPPGPQGNCPPGTSEYFYALQGRGLASSASPTATFQVTNPTACRDACSRNQAPSGPVQCAAAVYNADSSRCQLYTVDSTTQPLETQNGVFYLEKICIPAANDPKCPGEKGLFALADYMMSGNDLRQTTATSLKDCYLKCFATSGCKSANYYPGSGRCDMKSASSVSSPGAIIPTPGTEAVYYLDTECPQSRRFLADARVFDDVLVDDSEIFDWSNWSECVLMEHMFLRYRTSACPTKELCVETKSCN